MLNFPCPSCPLHVESKRISCNEIFLCGINYLKINYYVRNYIAILYILMPGSSSGSLTVCVEAFIFPLFSSTCGTWV